MRPGQVNAPATDADNDYLVKKKLVVFHAIFKQAVAVLKIAGS